MPDIATFLLLVWRGYCRLVPGYASQDLLWGFYNPPTLNDTQQSLPLSAGSQNPFFFFFFVFCFCFFGFFVYPMKTYRDIYKIVCATYWLHRISSSFFFPGEALSSHGCLKNVPKQRSCFSFSGKSQWWSPSNPIHTENWFLCCYHSLLFYLILCLLILGWL